MPRKLLLLVILIVAVIAAACGGAPGAGTGSSPEASGGGGRLTLVSYSTPREAYEELLPAFQKTAEGAGVRFDTSYGSSGEQSRAVGQGLAADVVALSLAPDVARLVKAGKVAEGWDGGEHKGMVTNSVVVIAVREGNPKQIRTWDDLTKDGIDVINPNPFTSGGARWNVMAAYGAQIEAGKSETEATQYLKDLFANISVQDKSAREALQTFAQGKGDAMLAYENEVITAQQKGEKLEYVVPDQTILIQNPIAVVADSENAAKAKAFVDFLRTPEAQRVFAEKGYRPVVESVLGEFEQYETPSGLFTIDDVGGWTEVMEKFFDPENGVVAGIERERGVDPESR